MPETNAPGVIDPGRLYSKAEIYNRFGLGPKSWRSLIDEGLPTTRVGKSTFVFADDFLAAIRKCKEASS